MIHAPDPGDAPDGDALHRRGAPWVGLWIGRRADPDPDYSPCSLVGTFVLADTSQIVLVVFFIFILFFSFPFLFIYSDSVVRSPLLSSPPCSASSSVHLIYTHTHTSHILELAYNTIQYTYPDSDVRIRIATTYIHSDSS